MSGAVPGPVLVTGGTGGIGAAVCRRLAGPGVRVAFTYRSNHDAARALGEELGALGAVVRSAALDLADAEAVAGFVEAYAGEAGLATVVHAAGPHVPMVHLSRVAPQDFRAALDAEVAGFFHLVSAALPALREAAARAGATGGASVTAVTTAGTSRHPARDGLSAGPKAAVESLVRAYAAEEGRFGVRFNCVGPGMLTDGMAERLMANGDLDERALAAATANIPLRRFGRAGDVADAVAYLAGAGFVTGQKLDVDGGYGV